MYTQCGAGNHAGSLKQTFRGAAFENEKKRPVAAGRF
jgi:hypothetical protein